MGNIICPPQRPVHDYIAPSAAENAYFTITTLLLYIISYDVRVYFCFNSRVGKACSIYFEPLLCNMLYSRVHYIE